MPQRGQRMSIRRRLRVRSASHRYGRPVREAGYGAWQQDRRRVNYTVPAMSNISRRGFVHTSLLGGFAAATQLRGQNGNAVPASITSLTPLPNPAPPITEGERRGRIAKAQQLMQDGGIGAIVLEGGTSMSY